MKHVGRRKAKAVGPRVKVGVFYFSGKCRYAQNEQLYTTFKCCFIFYLITSEIPQNKIFFLFSLFQSTIYCLELWQILKVWKIFSPCLKSSIFLKNIGLILQGGVELNPWMNCWWNPFKMLLLLQILYLLVLMRLLQYIIHFRFLCIYMLFKVGNKFHFWLVWKRWVCKEQLKTFFIWCSLPWPHLGVWMLNNREPNSFQWIAMVIMCFKVLKLVSLHKWKRMWLHFGWEYIILFIKPT